MESIIGLIRDGLEAVSREREREAAEKVGRIRRADPEEEQLRAQLDASVLKGEAQAYRRICACLSELLDANCF